MNYWIFQGNPNQYDFETALKNDELIVNWLVSSHKKNIKIDDKIIVWLTGDRSGCYALAKATSDPYNKKGSSPDDHLWKTPPTVNLRVGIKITHNFVTKPLTGNLLKHYNRKPKNTGFQGTNFLSNHEEYENILQLSNKKIILEANGSQSLILSNDELCAFFQCSPQGGMRRSKKTNTLVLVSNHVKSIYDDKWIGDVLHYTGMGTKGDQSLNYMQNPTLNESDSNNVEIHLFEVFEEKKYFYQGQVKLKSKPYQERQTDENGDSRSVWMFPLELINNTPARIDYKTIESLGNLKEKKTSKIDLNRLKEMVENQPKSTPSKRTTISETYERDEKIVRYALERSGGFCQLCEKPAPFKKKNGTPFLEVHHIDFLSNGGDDSSDNVSALCPNCHRKMHALAIQSDISKLKSKALKKFDPND